MTVISSEQYLKKILLAPIYEAAIETKLQPLNKLSARLGNHILLKREDLQPVHSFKLRGAYNKLANLSDQQKQNGVIAASAGNHAQGLALSAQKMGLKATIVMPKTEIPHVGWLVKFLDTEGNLVCAMEYNKPKE